MKSRAAIVHYREHTDSVAEAVELSGAFERVKRGDRVFVKPNIVVWSPKMPPYGVITTTRVVHDVVRLLKDCGAGRIVIGEGVMAFDPADKGIASRAFESLGYYALTKHYGVDVVDIFEREFQKRSLGDGIELDFAVDFLDSDFVVSVPVLKTHAQTKVSLAYKNLKGVIDMKSRKRCHSTDLAMDLNHHISKLASMVPRSAAVIDGIYSLERGPSCSGTARRSDLIVAAEDMLAADLVGCRMLGVDPAEVPHLLRICQSRGVSPSLKEMQIEGEPPEMWAKKHEWDFPYNEDGSLPIVMDFMKIKGLSFPKYDSTLCSYCSGITGMLQAAIIKTWKGNAFDNVEILTGKTRRPKTGMAHTVLVGKCQVELNGEHPDIRHPILLPGCPPKMDKAVEALREAGIAVDEASLTDCDAFLDYFNRRYNNKPDFTRDFYRE